jgi:hypothetical protein
MVELFASTLPRCDGPLLVPHAAQRSLWHVFTFALASGRVLPSDRHWRSYAVASREDNSKKSAPDRRFLPLRPRV